jgi:ribosomal protein S18 acetylase RimI-like enzyme
VRLAQRVGEVWRAEGWRGLRARAKRRFKRLFWGVHLVVMALTDSPRVKTTNHLEFKRVLETDDEDLETLASVDPWNTPKHALTGDLRKGWMCFVEKTEGRIAASAWAIVGPSFVDECLGRQFALGAEEAYHLRGFRVPEFRDVHILPQLLRDIVSYLRETANKTRHLMLVRHDNAAARVFRKLGYKTVGEVGLLQLFCFRFHYLRGRGAFAQTRRRFQIEIVTPGKGPRWS